MKDEKVRAHIRVYGRVQGIGFRYFAVFNAKALDVKGFIKNLKDGSVEGVFEGKKEDVKSLIDRIRRHPLARIDKMDIKWEKAKNEFDDFNMY
ncbi:MAG: acylphosphatase [Candidatus Parvarchaeota archaeon]|nr:acylphosphatase [Candidatus Jingweiarchaeum tengchongense]MCW1298011.1 acylphosphatase [Candidatus Jingweiarchaeum tengchongense]MCW1300188.1 acylphosphatase [Candidatus Jingweiarchaeum tengchongense]MCW1304398.1 acylphosphatase [Candidatus Jingweiarchaeum tengchongense]MCW1305949.1 acylphosphatase [Candidatus Jingweiarchaeum tengchongense]